MTKRTDWIPLIVIPAMVYINALPKEVMPNAEAQLNRSAERSSPEHVVQGAAYPHNAEVVQGVDAKGSAFVWERNPKYPVIEFVMILTDERR